MNQPSTDEFYRQLHTGTPGDADFYSRLVSKSDRVLELGCGWGRVTCVMAPLCQSITGIDNNRNFCAAARESLAPYPNARVLHHDIRHPPNEAQSLCGTQSLDAREYDRIIAPYNLLYALGGANGARAAFRFVSQQLAKGGEFWADVYPVDEMHAALKAGDSPPEDDDEPVGELEWQSVRYPILESSTLDLHRQQLEVHYRASRPGDPQAIVARASLHHDYLLLDQLEHILHEAGLEIALLLGGFDGRGYDEDAEQLVICAKHRSGPG